jgi:hypothetical protein
VVGATFVVGGVVGDGAGVGVHWVQKDMATFNKTMHNVDKRMLSTLSPLSIRSPYLYPFDPHIADV